MFSVALRLVVLALTMAAAAMEASHPRIFASGFVSLASIIEILALWPLVKHYLSTRDDADAPKLPSDPFRSFVLHVSPLVSAALIAAYMPAVARLSGA